MCGVWGVGCGVKKPSKLESESFISQTRRSAPSTRGWRRRRRSFARWRPASWCRPARRATRATSRTASRWRRRRRTGTCRTPPPTCGCRTGACGTRPVRDCPDVPPSSITDNVASVGNDTLTASTRPWAKAYIDATIAECVSPPPLQMTAALIFVSALFCRLTHALAGPRPSTSRWCSKSSASPATWARSAFRPPPRAATSTSPWFSTRSSNLRPRVAVWQARATRLSLRRVLLSAD